jgi:muconate cycloisomerase
MEAHEVQLIPDHAGAGGAAGTRIRTLDVFDIALPSRRDLSWRGLHETLGEWSLVRVETDDGTVGWGEATPLGSWGGDLGRYFGETPRTVRHMVRDVLGPRLVDVDPFDLTEIHRRMEEVVRGHPYAKGAIDIALHDLQGKILGLPVHRLLGGLARPAVPVAHMVGIMSVEEAVHEAAGAVADGVRTLQIKGAPSRGRRRRPRRAAGRGARADGGGPPRVARADRRRRELLAAGRPHRHRPLRCRGRDLHLHRQGRRHPDRPQDRRPG